VSLWVPAREPSRELLDAGLPFGEAEKSLADIEWVHQRLGGRRLLRRALVPVVRSLAVETPSLLDLGCGSGHVARDLERELARRRCPSRVSGLDLQAAHARLAPRGRTLVGDAVRLPFADSSFDVVFSTLFLHHFSPGELRPLLAESARVARRAVLAFDLARHRASLAIVSLLGPLVFRTPVSVADGRASVRQAFTPDEIAAIAGEVLPGAAVSPAGPFVWRLLWRKS
jgi:SAM-dependent methyltransferase